MHERDPAGDAGRWCMDRRERGPRACGPCSPSDRDRRRPTVLHQPVEDVAGESGLDDLSVTTSCAKAAADDRLVSEERVLDPSLAMVTGLLLPLSSSDLANPTNRSITGCRSWTSDARCLDRWDDDTHPSVRCCVVERARVVRRVGGHRGDLAVELLDEFDTRLGVIGVRVGQYLSNDDAVCIDSEVQLLPALQPLATVLRGRPLAFADDL